MCNSLDIKFFLFDPIENKFQIKDKENLISEKKEKFDIIFIESNLDKISFMNLINIINLEKYYNNYYETNVNIKAEYWKGLAKFLEDFQRIKMNINKLKDIFNVENLIYYYHFKIDNEIISPRKHYIILYKKKNNYNFIGVKNSFNNISCFDLENNKKVGKYIDLIDFNYDYSYVLYFEEKLTHKRTLNEIDNGEYLMIKMAPTPKFI